MSILINKKLQLPLLVVSSVSLPYFYNLLKVCNHIHSFNQLFKVQITYHRHVVIYFERKRLIIISFNTFRSFDHVMYKGSGTI